MYENCSRHPSFIKLNTICCIYIFKILMWHTIHLYKTHQGWKISVLTSNHDDRRPASTWHVNSWYTQRMHRTNERQSGLSSLQTSPCDTSMTNEMKISLDKIRYKYDVTGNTITGNTRHVTVLIFGISSHFQENLYSSQKFKLGHLHRNIHKQTAE